jgi:putative molybdopterin biosynthesis protein
LKRTSDEPQVTNNLAELRKQRGLSASELAAEVGISRQAIYSIEAGSYVPNTALSLRFAQVLGVGLEDIFRLKNEEPPRSLEARLISGDAKVTTGQALQLCRINGRLVAAQPSPQEWYLPASDAVADSEANAGKIKVRLHRNESEFENRVIIAGCDPATSILTRRLQMAGIEAVLVHRNSSESLDLLKQGRVHIAGTHLRAGPAIKNRFSRDAVAVIAFAHWQEGLVTAPGNPKHIKNIEDLARNNVRFVNRERGAGTRLLLDDALSGLHIKPSQIRGYDDEVCGHLAAALYVKNGAAHCCIATDAAARFFGLTFVPLQSARYDLVIRRSYLGLAPVRALLDAIVQANFRRELSGYAGYDTAVTGTRVL